MLASEVGDAAGPVWLIYTVRPATAMVPVRRLPVLTPTVYAMAPMPVQLLDELKRIHGTFAMAFHWQSGALRLTAMVPPVTPAAATEIFLVGRSRKQGSPA